MANTNRARIDVKQPGQPRLYQPSDLPGWDIVGEVSRGDETGALVKNRNAGVYAMARAGAITNLEQRKTKAALGEWAPAQKLKGGERRSIHLDAELIEKAGQIGNGNVSEGVREALRAYNV